MDQVERELTIAMNENVGTPAENSPHRDLLSIAEMQAPSSISCHARSTSHLQYIPIITGSTMRINSIVTKTFQNVFEINVIPHTLQLTNLKNLKINSLVNVELDILSKYIYKYSN